MKRLILYVVIASVLGAMTLLVVRHHSPPASPTQPATASVPAPEPETAVPESPSPLAPQPSHQDSPTVQESPVVVASTGAPDKSDEIRQIIEKLLSPQTSFSERQAMWQKLKAAGELDQVVAELKQRAAANPDDPAIPTAIGEALLNKFPIADPDESALNGIHMDKSFDQALQLDPSNWEAQFYKALELSYWPAEMNKGPEVVQRFSALIDQQETMPTQPQFAQTYALLGDFYQKTGQADKATATWQLGLSEFPNDSTLEARLAAHP
jgi:tetratricopeptide (TPR) repeat protein